MTIDNLNLLTHDAFTSVSHSTATDRIKPPRRCCWNFEICVFFVYRISELKSHQERNNQESRELSVANKTTKRVTEFKES